LQRRRSEAKASCKQGAAAVFFVMVFVQTHSSTLPEGNKLRHSQQKRTPKKTV
jgi:hypothetical protein